MSKIEVELVPRDPSVQELLDRYQRCELSYEDLCDEFRKRGWSTLSLYEVVRNIERTNYE